MSLSRALPVSLTFLFLLSACSFSLAGDVTPPPGYQEPAASTVLPTAAAVELRSATASPDPAAGAAIYAESCAPCHGDAGRGDGFQADRLPNPASPIGDPDLALQSVPIDWFRVISEGRMDRFMPPFANSLSDQQRWDTLAYVYTLSASEGGASEGAALFEENCAACHGTTGRGDGPEAAGLASQVPDITTPEFFASRASASLFQAITDGAGADMPPFGTELSEAERWALADYVRTMAYAAPGEAVVLGPTEAPSAGEGATSITDPDQLEAETAGEETVQLVGKVTGVMTNGSGGDVPAGLTVTLHGFDHITEVFSTTTTVEANGSYVFEDVEMPPSRVFLVTTEYSEATYNSDIATVESGTQVINLPVTIYDTTDDSSMLVVDRLHIFLEAQEPGSLRVIELYLLLNPTDKVIVGAEKDQPVVHYKLPEGATGLRFGMGTPDDRFIITEDGVADTMGIPPGSGQYQVMFAYDIPYDRKARLSHPLTLPVNSVVLLVPDIGLKAKGDGLEDTGVQQFQDESYRVYRSSRYSAGSELDFSISGSVSGGMAGAGSQEGAAGLMAGGIALGLALVTVGVWAVRRFYLFPKREPAPAPPSRTAAATPAPAESDFETVESVLDAIIALDDLHGAGKLSEEAYFNRRRELFAILERMKGGAGQPGG